MNPLYARKEQRARNAANAYNCTSTATPGDAVPVRESGGTPSAALAQRNALWHALAAQQVLELLETTPNEVRSNSV
jgi:hypothetical protein